MQPLFIYALIRWGIIIMIQRKALKSREVEQNFSSHTASKWQRQNSNPVGQFLEFILDY